MSELQLFLKMPPAPFGESFVKHEYRAGVDYQVYPCVMLVEGVHKGVGADAVYYSPEILSESAPNWNNLPVTVGHPVNLQGEHVLCNPDGTIRQEWEVGHIINARIEDGKLKADIYLNVQRVKAKAPALLQYLQNGGELQVSTGMLAGLDDSSGTWNGEEYGGAVTTIIPDHLALLPDSTGACNWDDGCGVRFNAESHESNKEENTMADKKEEKCCPERVLALITNEATAYTDEDREWLEALNEDQFVKVEGSAIPIINEDEPEELTLDSIVESAGEFQGVLNEALDARNEKRQGIIDKLLNHDGNKFTAEQLGEMETEMLTNMVGYIGKEKKVEKKPTYSGKNPNNDSVVSKKKVEPPELVTLTSHINNDKEEK